MSDQTPALAVPERGTAEATAAPADREARLRQPGQEGPLLSLAALYDLAKTRGRDIHTAAVKHLAADLGYSLQEIESPPEPEALSVPDCAKPVRRFAS